MDHSPSNVRPITSLKLLRWLVLFPFRLIALAYALSGVVCLYLVGLGRAYVATIISNIASNFISRDIVDLDAERQKHTHVLAATGAGKSSLIEYFLDRHIWKGQGFLLIEPFGELTKRVLANKRFTLFHRSGSYRKLVLLDFDSNPPALNIFALPLPKREADRRHFVYGLASDLADAFAVNMKPAFTEAQHIMLRNLFIVGFHMKAASFLDIIELLSDAGIKKIDHILPSLPTPPLRNYFEQDFTAGPNRPTRTTLRGRLNSFVIPSQIYSSLCAPACDVDFEAILAENKHVVVKATATTLGNYEAVTLGNLVHCILAKYMFARLHESRGTPPFFIYFDEAQYYMTESVERALTGARKTGVCYTLAHQDLGQIGINPAMQKSILNNCNVKIYGSLRSKDMKEAADMLGIEDRQRLARLRVGHFLIKAGRYETFHRHFPSKFAIKREGFGNGWLINAYARPEHTKAMLKHISPKRPQPMYEKTVTAALPPAPIQSIKFNPNGNMPFGPRPEYPPANP